VQYVLAEADYAAYETAWAVVFAVNDLILCSLGATYLAAGVLSIASFYGDHVDKAPSSSTGGRDPTPMFGPPQRERRICTHRAGTVFTRRRRRRLRLAGSAANAAAEQAPNGELPTTGVRARHG
jgi:hypothetical protein